MYLLLYAAAMCLMVGIREYGQKATTDRFLLADRRIGGTIGAMSIAASWIWAPAIFVSTRVGYEWGYSGVVWFVLPNMLALVVFAPLAASVRNRLPLGYSYVQSLSDIGGGFRRVQLSTQLGMQIVIFAIQLTAGAELLATVTGASYYGLVIGMGLTPLAYAFYSGLRTSTFTDAIQYIAIATIACCIVFFFPGMIESWHPGSFSAAFSDSRPFAPFNSEMLWQFGLSSSMGLIVAIFADHQQWQRAFAAKQDRLVRSFWLGAVFHGVVTSLLAIFGCLIAKYGFSATGPLELVGVSFIKGHYAAPFLAFFVVMALCALISTLDSGLCAFSSLAVTEVFPPSSDTNLTLRRCRLCMVALVAFGLVIGLLRPSLLSLWFLAGTIRLSTFAPTLASILLRRFSGAAGTCAVASGLVIGGSVFGYGIWTGNMQIRTLGMMLSVGISAAVIMLWLALRYARELSKPRRYEVLTAN